MLFLIKPPSPPLPEPVATLVTVEPAATFGSALAHADYNLHPLIVRGLEHYLDQDESDDRFHVR